MKFSKNWLEEFVDIKTSNEELCEQLTMLGLEVEDFSYINSPILGEDAVFKLDITPNRGDCFSILGIAREIASLNKVSLRFPKINQIKEKIESPISIKTNEAAPRYIGRYVDDININKETLPIIKERLKLSGFRSIDPVVDITNYVLLELGQPLHAFDASKLEGNLRVRFARKDEKIILLNEEEIELSKECLVISDEKSAVAFAGIMGGVDTGVSNKTNSIYLESAFFAPHVIRGKARVFDIQTDASLRFERGVDYNLQKKAIERVSDLINLNLGGVFGPIQESLNKNTLPKQKSISVNCSRVNSLLGSNFPKKTMVEKLRGLELHDLSPSSKNSIKVKVPSWRFDLDIDMDLVEEIARVTGYDKLPQRSLPSNPRESLQGDIIALKKLPFLSLGYNEVITYSFIDEKEARLAEPGNDLIFVTNPISSNMSVMRPSLWPGLLNTFIFNFNRGLQDSKIVELGKTFKKNRKGKISEKTFIGGLISGLSKNINWSEKSSAVNFFDLKGDLETVYSSLRKDVEFRRSSHPYLHPGKTASINLRGQKKNIGFIGSLNPKILDKYDIKQEIFLFEVLAESLGSSVATRFKNFSKHPVIQRDLAFVVSKNKPSRELIKLITNNAGKNLTNLKVFDVYEGKGIPEGKKSIAFSLTWQAGNRTLLDKEVDVFIKKIVRCLTKELNAKLRT